MRSTVQSATFLAALLLLGACGSANKKGTPCPVGTAAGATLGCQCGTAAALSAGQQLCQNDRTLSACMCVGPGSAGTAGLPATGPLAGTGGAGGSGGTGGALGTVSSGGTGTGATGGAGGISGTGGAAAIDGGTTTGDGGPSPINIPTDGTKLSVCTTDRECNKGLGCVKLGTGEGFCSPTCTANSDCASLTGAKFTCATTTHLCSASCSGTTDMMSCPEGMICTRATNAGGLPPATYACQWPVGAGEPPSTKVGPFGACLTSMECMDGSICQLSAGLGRTMGKGYCTHSCRNAEECTDKPVGGGTITPSCQTSSSGRTCQLTCTGAMMGGCPTDMSCKFGLGISSCQYN